MATYTCLRNALFHNSEFAAIGKDEKGAEVKLRLNDFLPNFSQLVSLVILKAVEFDDGSINWNRWVSMQN